MTDSYASRTYAAWPAPSLWGYRHQAMLTQAELAERAGVDPSTIYRLEIGGRATRATLRKLARALKVRVDDLRAEPAA